MTEQGHCPVLLTEVLELLSVGREGVYVDCTLGLAGHAVAILERNPRASLVGLDRDEISLRQARERLMPFGGRVRLFHTDFKYLPALGIDFRDVRGVLVDLGMSSFQLDSPERGFSFSQEGPLDMRMDQRSKITASKVLHTYSEQKLADLFETCGELPHSRRLAREVVRLRKLGRVETTSDLRRIIEEVYRWRPQKGKIHPAAKAFQALRIEVNRELEGLAEFLEETVRMSVVGTRFVAISFHSLEDRIVKHTFAGLASPRDREPLLTILTRKPVMAGPDEVAGNSRARSAKLRAAERA
ncbi:MAG: 16S rRNA (cytosine(1402)-N(4))-methyltransferase RsmH [Candidatus Aminicenantales bacterium]|jgi:16S rRNA (cytosine1402-N4)-methyltransferase